MVDYGRYVKHFNTPRNDENTVLAFNANGLNGVKVDNWYIGGKLCHTTGTQCVETRQELGKFFEMEIDYNTGKIGKIEKYFNILLYSFYNRYGQRVKSIFVRFDFEKSTITVNGRTLKVENNSEFVYKVLKTKIKAKDGIKGFYKFVLEAMHCDNVFNCQVYSVLCKIGGISDN